VKFIITSIRSLINDGEGRIPGPPGPSIKSVDGSPLRSWNRTIGVL